MRKSTAPKKSCVNCHFLQRRDRFENGLVQHSHWEDSEIENRKLDEKPHLARVPICSQGVWDGGIDTSLDRDDERLKRKIEKNRKETCFFIKRSRSMSNDAAYRLWEKSVENREIKRSYRFTSAALGVTVIGIIINSIIGILGLEDHKWDTLREWAQFLFNWVRPG